MPKKTVIKTLTKALEEGLLPVRPRTVYGWIQEGKYPDLIFKLFGKIVIDLSELDSMVKEAKQSRKHFGCSGNCTCNKRSHAKKIRKR